MAYQIDDKTAVPSPPSLDLSSVGDPGYFTSGDPNTGQPATVVRSDWLNMIQDEILGVVSGAGMTLDKTNNGQLLAAIKKLIPPPVETDLFQPVGDYALVSNLTSEVQRAEAAEAALQRGYRLINRQVFMNGGSYPYMPTAGTRVIVVKLCGGGGGGAGANANGSGYVTLGLGGCGGTYAETGLLPAPTSPVTVVVGSGGAGGATAGYGGSASCYGFNGGVSSFGSVITCPGGPGAPAPTNFASAPNSGTATVFTPAATGTVAWQSVGGAPLGWCSFGIVNTYGSFVFGSLGGASLFGSGGAWGNRGSGFNAVNPGAGGGAATSNPGAGGTGGNGADGIVIIEEYC